MEGGREGGNGGRGNDEGRGNDGGRGRDGVVEGGRALELTHLGSSSHSIRRRPWKVAVSEGARRPWGIVVIRGWGVVVVCWWGVVRVRLGDALVVALVARRGFRVMV